MLCDAVEKRIQEVSETADELGHVLSQNGWTDYALGLLSRLQRLAIILDDEDVDAESRLDEILLSKTQ